MIWQFKVKAHCNIKQYEQAVLYTSTPTCATLIRYINHRAKHPLDFIAHRCIYRGYCPMNLDAKPFLKFRSVETVEK